MKKLSTKTFFAVLCAVMLFVCSSCGANGSKQTQTDNLNMLNNKAVGWGPGKISDNTRPQSAVSFNQKYGHLNAIFIKEDTKNIYLTFDQGYENGYTALILDTLKEKGVKAVFFITYDYVNKNPELVKRMIDEGHTLGNHSWSHPSMPSCTTEKAKEEIMRLHDLVREQFNYQMKLFRFPRGEYSEKMLALVKQCGYQSVFWSFAYVDWKTESQPSESEALKKLESGVHNGAVILLHSVSKTNCNILPRAIDSIKSSGYVFSEYKL